MEILYLATARNRYRWLISIILLGVLLRLPWLTAQSIAFDESFSLVVGLSKWPILFQALLSDGVHPPLFYIIHKGALNLWGTSEFGQRFLTAMFSIVAIPLVYKAGRIIFNRDVALLGALFLAVNPLHIWFAQEARMYSLLGMLTLISMIVFWQAMQTRRLQYWVALAVVNSIIFALHYFGFLIPTTQFLFIILTFPRNYRSLRPWAIAQTIAFLPLLPWLIATAMREAQTFGIGFLSQPSRLDFFITLWNLAVGSSTLFWPATILIMGVMAAALIMAFRFIPPHKVGLRQARLLVGLWALAPPLTTWLVSQRRSFYADRYLSFAIPGLVLLLAFGVIRIRQTQWQIVLTVGLVLANGYGLIATHLDPAFWKDNWRGAAAYITQNEDPQDVILLYSTHIKFAFDYYYQGHIPQKPISLNLEKYPIDPLTANHQRVWVVYPYTRRPTHYPMQPLIPNGFWADDPERNPNLVEWFDNQANNVIDYQHFRGVELWLVDLNRNTNND